MTFRWLILLIAQWLMASSDDLTNAKSEEDFETKVRPLLVEKCHSCHGPKEQEGGLRLTQRAEVLRGGDNGPAIVIGEPEKSLLIQAIGYQGDLKMPPDGKLSDTQIATLTRWVKNGAAWPAEAASVDSLPKETRPEQKRDLWSLQQVREVQLPDVQRRDWPTTPIDQFLLASMEQNGLTSSAPADKRSLIRRLTFDLTGLPPSPDEVQAFLQDASPTAYAKLVNRLLASPQYGERWGRHWLDVVRYADARDLIQLPAESDFREAWRYRDWVVKAFNQDLPYDQFVQRQIAGDLLQPADKTQLDADALVATGMLAIADFVPGDVDKEQMIADYVNDQIDVVGRAFLGLTIACARCHDHKFDPISTEDYYSLAGIFFSSRLIPGPVAGNTPLVRAPLLPVHQIKEIEGQTARDKKRIAELTTRVQSAIDREFFTQRERQLEASITRELPLAIKWFHLSRGADRAALESFAKEHAIQVALLERWQAFLQHAKSRSALASLLTEKASASPLSDDEKSAIEGLIKKLATITASRPADRASDPNSKSLRERELVRLRADDPYIEFNGERQITRWPNRATIAEDAVPSEKTTAPYVESVDIHGAARSILRFDGSALLKLAQNLPTTGTLVALFRPAPGAAGTRLVGWEDAAVGQHGVGLLLRDKGALHAIVRRNGASGDVATSSETSDWQLVSLSWGPSGTQLFRDGQPVGSNPAIDSASCDPAISALKIGGPGSGEGQRFVGDLCELRVYAGPLDEPARLRVESEIRSHWLTSAAAKVAPRADSPSSEEQLTDLYTELLSSRGPYWVTSDKRLEALPPSIREQLAAERTKLEQLQAKPPVEIPRAVVIEEGGPPGTKHEGFHDAPVFIRGNPKKPGKVIPRGFPTAFADAKSHPIQKGSGRLELAQWITSEQNPLTARVLVNRIWQRHFGEGLVRTSTNFGARGELPSHPELLDYLAHRLVDSGWSIKELQRMIVLSNAYQQSSFTNAPAGADPDNRLLSHMPRRRLEAEAVRDSLLAASGLLSTNIGGPGFLEIAVPRRTLYLMSVRTGTKTSDFAALFDGASGGGIIERRNQTIVAPQALFFMNDVWIEQIAIALSERARREAPSDTAEDRIARLYEILFARPPSEQETAIGLQLVGDKSAADAWVRYGRVLLCSNEFLFLD